MYRCLMCETVWAPYSSAGRTVLPLKAEVRPCPDCLIKMPVDDKPKKR